VDQWFVDKARKGEVYHAHNTTAGEVTVLSATCTGLVLENPFGSGKQLVVHSMAFVGSTLTTIREVGVAVSSLVSETLSTSTTAANIHNGRPTGTNNHKGVAKAYSVATLASTPVWLRPIGNARVTAADEGRNALEAVFDGTIIVSPGTYICLSALTTATTGLCSMTWAEEKEGLGI